MELQPAACGLFRRTAAENGLEDRLRCLEGDLRDPGLTAEPPLLLRGPDGGETEDVRRAYFRDKE